MASSSLVAFLVLALASPCLGGVTVSWTIGANDTDITFSVVGQDIPGWVSIGISNDKRMANTDVIWARSSGSSVVVEDAYCTSHDAPARDFSQDITVVSAALEGSSISFEVTRPVVTPDTNKDIAITLDQKQYLIVAYHTSSASSFSRLPEHSHVDVFQTSWRDGQLTPARSNAVVAHGVLMGIAWGVLIPLGMLTARLGKKYKQWFNAHRSLQMLGLLLAAIGFLIALTMDGYYESSFPHGAVGVLVMLMGCAQPVIAWVRPKDKTSVPRKRWYVVHAGLGLVCGVLGWLNCFTGMDIYGSPAGLRWALWAFVAVVVAAVIGAEIFKRTGGAQQPKEQEAQGLSDSAL